MAVSKYTVANIREKYHRLVTPGDPSSPKFLDALNEVVERFANDHPWKNALATLILPVNTTDNTISLPAEYESITQAQVDGHPKTVYAGGYEFVGFGDKDLDDGTDCVLVDNGDNYGTFVDVPADDPSVLSLTASNVADVKAVRIFGLDGNGDEVFDTNGVPGEEVVPGNSTTNSYSKVTALVKGVTSGTLTLTHVNTSTVLQVYMPWMTNPTFRRYHIVGETDTKVKARCRMRFIPLQMEEQFVVPGNSGAIKLGLQALGYENENDLERASIHWEMANKLLNEELRASRGGGRVLPNISLWGEGIPPLRSSN